MLSNTDNIAPSQVPRLSSATPGDKRIHNESTSACNKCLQKTPQSTGVVDRYRRTRILSGLYNHEGAVILSRTTCRTCLLETQLSERSFGYFEGSNNRGTCPTDAEETRDLRVCSRGAGKEKHGTSRACARRDKQPRPPVIEPGRVLS